MSGAATDPTRFLQAIEAAYLTLQADGDYHRFTRAVEAALRAWRAA